MIVNTVRFGEIEVEEEKVFDFKLPIIGFSELRKFIILDVNQESAFKWLQSIEDPSLAFPVISVFGMNGDYSIDIPDEAVEKLNITDVNKLLVMNIASIPHNNPQGTTINLLAPLIFNLETQTAAQVILSGSGYDISFPLFKKV